MFGMPECLGGKEPLMCTLFVSEIKKDRQRPTWRVGTTQAETENKVGERETERERYSQGQKWSKHRGQTGREETWE